MIVISPSISSVRNAMSSKGIQADISTKLPNSEVVFRELLGRGVKNGLSMRVIYAAHLAAGGVIPSSSCPVNPLDTDLAEYFA